LPSGQQFRRAVADCPKVAQHRATAQLAKNWENEREEKPLLKLFQGLFLNKIAVYGKKRRKKLSAKGGKKGAKKMWQSHKRKKGGDFWFRQKKKKYFTSLFLFCFYPLSQSDLEKKLKR
jgi:hypothetical protein